MPSELLQSIEVSKALTPDMDADSIGGSVNLVMKQAPEKLRLFGAVGGGYNELLDSYEQNNYSLTTGRRFNGGKTGLIVSGSGSETNRGNQDMEVVYTPTLTLNELNPRWYQVHRRRVGFTGAFDVKQSADSQFTVRAVFNRFIDDHENRQRVRFAVANRRIDHELRDRTHIERITSLGLDRPANRRRIGDGRLSGGRRVFRSVRPADDDDDVPPHQRQLPAERHGDVDRSRTTSRPTRRTKSCRTTTSCRSCARSTSPRTATSSAQVNARLPLRASNASTSFLKFGAKFRDKSKGRNRNESTVTSPTTLKMTSYLETGFDLPPYLDGRYDLTPYMSQSLVENIPNQITADDHAETTRATPRSSTAPNG